jgi:hypothetical protein
MRKGRPKLQPKLPSPEQEAWLKEHFKLYTCVHLAGMMGIGVKMLRAWCRHLELKKRVIAEKPAKQIIRFVQPVKPPRPISDHTNMTREQRIESWLNYPI